MNKSNNKKKKYSNFSQSAVITSLHHESCDYTDDHELANKNLFSIFFIVFTWLIHEQFKHYSDLRCLCIIKCNPESMVYHQFSEQIFILRLLFVTQIFISCKQTKVILCLVNKQNLNIYLPLYYVWAQVLHILAYSKKYKVNRISL